MSEHITLTIPDRPEYFAAAAAFFECLGSGNSVTDQEKPAASEPPAPAATPAAPDGVNVDSAGLPWDGRIHASSKAVNKDGTWRRRRNLDKDFIENVEAELRATMNAASEPPAPAAAPAAPAAPAASEPPAPAAAPAAPAASEPPAPAAPAFGRGEVPAAPAASEPPAPAAAPAAPAASEPPAPASGLQFGDVMQAVTQAIHKGQIHQDTVNEIARDVGLPSVVMLSNRPDLLQPFYDKLTERMAG